MIRSRDRRSLREAWMSVLKKFIIHSQNKMDGFVYKYYTLYL